MRWGSSHEPVQITGKRESIPEGMATEVSELSSEPLW
jgi:hypothetical protein